MSSDEGLDDTVLAFIGERVYAWPFYVWGWANVSDDPFEVPEPFHMRITQFWDMPPGERRGGIGVIEEPGHRYDGYWTQFSTRHVGVFNFTTAIDDFNISMAPYEPTFRDDGWPTFGVGPGSKHPGGYCRIASTKERWEEHRAAELAKAEGRRIEWDRRRQS